MILYLHVLLVTADRSVAMENLLHFNNDSEVITSMMYMLYWFL